MRTRADGARARPSRSTLLVCGATLSVGSASGQTAHVKFPFTRLDRCFPGLAEAQKVTNQAFADAATEAWLRVARQAAPRRCFTEATSEEGVYGSLVSHVHRFVFQINPKAASNTLVTWMKCELGAQDASGAAPADYLRVSATRDPWPRIVSAYGQVVELIQKGLNGRSPVDIRACTSKRADAPASCLEWGNVNRFHLGALRVRDSFIAGLVHQLASTRFHKQSHPLQGTAAEFVEFLKLVARTYGLGCDPEWFSGEHAWPQWMVFAPLKRLDFVFRVETLKADQHRFLRVLRGRRGEPLPNTTKCRIGASTGDGMCPLKFCQVGERGNSRAHEASDDVNFRKMLDNSPRLLARWGFGNNSSAYRHVDVRPAKLLPPEDSPLLATMQHLVCAIYLPDFVCNGYSLPQHCETLADGTMPWLAESMRQLVGPRRMASTSSADL